VATSSNPRGATSRLVMAIALGVLISIGGMWLFFSDALPSLERRSVFTYFALGMVAVLAAGVWFRRIQSKLGKRDALSFLFHLCGALSLVTLAVLFLLQGLIPEIPPLWDEVGIFLALALASIYVTIALYRIVQRIRNYRYTSET
jgi:fucose 4-O-acetylase-like acetyltransferase